MKEAFDLLPDIYWVVQVDPPGTFNLRFELFNRAYEEQIGISHAEAVGKTPWEVFSVKDATAIMGHHVDCLLCRTTITYTEHLKINGVSRWWRTKLTPSKNDEGRINRIIGTTEPVAALESELRDAISQNRLRVAYQPIVRLDGNCIAQPCTDDCLVGYEALIRWPGSGYSPTDFLPIAISNNLMPLITRQVLFAVGRQLSILPPPLWIAVNVADCDIAHDLEQMLELYQDIPRKRIPLEITENTTMNTSAVTRFARLQGLGHPIEFDDYGTSSANLAWLQQVSPDAIKLDLTFVRGVDYLPIKQKLCRSAIDLAHGYEPRISVVAEGVETIEEMQWLQQQGVEFGQGYLFSKPLWGEEL